jgi:magnesium-dependent phosphatase 1
MQLVVFDLDYTIWQPEMYQIDGPPKLMSIDEFRGKQKRKSSTANLRPIPPGSNTIYQNKIVTDQRGTAITVFDGAAHALSEILRMKKGFAESGPLLRVAISSRTDEPSWAIQIMQWLTAADGTPLSKCFDQQLIEISYADKARHFENLNRKTGIAYESMAFFDNEIYNIKSVGQLGVKCYHTPNGMTREDWNQCLEDFGIN